MNMIQTRRIRHVQHDKGRADCQMQTALQGAPGMVVCVRSELGKDVRSEELS